MKGKLKSKILSLSLAGAMVVPAMFSFVACGPTDPSDLTVEEKDQAFVAMKTLASNDLVEGKSIISKTYLKNNMTYDFTNSGLSEEMVTMMQSMMSSSAIETYQRNQKGYTAEGEGYNISEEKLSETDEYVIDEAEYIKKNDNEYRLYTYDTYESDDEVIEEKRAYNISADHAKHEYQDLSDSMQGFDLSAVAGDATTLEAFKDAATAYALESFIVEGSADTDGVQASCDIELEDGVYTFSANLSVEDLNMVVEGVNMDASIDATLEVTFTETQMLTYTANTSTELDGTMSTAEMGLGGSGTIGISGSTIMNFENDYTQDYDPSLMPTDFSDYITSDNPISNMYSSMYLNIDGYEDYIRGISFNEDADFSLENILQWSDISADNATITLYLDEDMTIEANVTNMAKYPSYDLDLYAKFEANDGYTKLVVVSDEGYGYTELESLLAVAKGANFDFSELLGYHYGYEIDSITINGEEVTDLTNLSFYVDDRVDEYEIVVNYVDAE